MFTGRGSSSVDTLLLPHVHDTHKIVHVNNRNFSALSVEFGMFN